MKQAEAIAAIEKLVTDQRLNAKSLSYASVKMAIDYPGKAVPCSDKNIVNGQPVTTWVMGVTAACYMADIPFEITKDKDGREFVKVSLTKA
jgi:hypothetical protein